MTNEVKKMPHKFRPSNNYIHLNSTSIQWNFNEKKKASDFHSWKFIWRCPQNVSCFVTASMCKLLQHIGLVFYRSYAPHKEINIRTERLLKQFIDFLLCRLWKKCTYQQCVCICKGNITVFTYTLVGMDIICKLSEFTLYPLKQSCGISIHDFTIILRQLECISHDDMVSILLALLWGPFCH